jgi:hypothetical protein
VRLLKRVFLCRRAVHWRVVWYINSCRSFIHFRDSTSDTAAGWQDVQFNIVFGLSSFLSMLLAGWGPSLAVDAGCGGLSLYLYTVMCFGIPESPVG